MNVVLKFYRQLVKTTIAEAVEVVLDADLEATAEVALDRDHGAAEVVAVDAIGPIAPSSPSVSTTCLLVASE